MKRINIVTTLTCVFMIIIFAVVHSVFIKPNMQRENVKVGFIYDGDEVAPYTYNFIRAQKALENKYGSKITVYTKSNVYQSDAESALYELAENGCDIIFTTSFGYGEGAKKFAAEYPNIEFCQATCANANEEPVLPNYHTFMGEIYEGRYVSGIVVGMKLNELISNNTISSEEAKIGYVAAFPYPEVISGYTAFFLGVRSVCPSAVMSVRYTNTWTSYNLEKTCAEKFIEEDCIVISQHSDTIGPAFACENAKADHIVYHVGYNHSMLDTAPTTSLLSTRINWAPYILGAVEAVFAKEKIESHIDAHIHGNDAGAGFEKDWVQIVELNSPIVPDGAEEAIENAISNFKNDNFMVFKGNYTGTDPFDKTDTIDLSKGYKENENTSAPSFHYILDDVITIEES